MFEISLPGKLVTQSIQELMKFCLEDIRWELRRWRKGDGDKRDKLKGFTNLAWTLGQTRVLS
jgi:hypothetical protein